MARTKNVFRKTAPPNRNRRPYQKYHPTHAHGLGYRPPSAFWSYDDGLNPYYAGPKGINIRKVMRKHYRTRAGNATYATYNAHKAGFIRNSNLIPVLHNYRKARMDRNTRYQQIRLLKPQTPYYPPLQTRVLPARPPVEIIDLTRPTRRYRKGRVYGGDFTNK